MPEREPADQANQEFVEDVMPAADDPIVRVILDLADNDPGQNNEVEVVIAHAEEIMHEQMAGEIRRGMTRPRHGYNLARTHPSINLLNYANNNRPREIVVHNVMREWGRAAWEMRNRRGYTNDAPVDRANAQFRQDSQMPLKDRDPQWLVEHIKNMPTGWNRNLVGDVVKMRLRTEVDHTLGGVESWLGDFGTPLMRNGEKLFDINDEKTLVLALLFGQNPAKLPSRSTRIERLFSSAGFAKLYTALHAEMLVSEEPNIDRILSDSPVVDDDLMRTIADCRRYGLSITPKQQTDVLKRVVQISRRREAYITEAQNWLQSNATTPGNILGMAWKYRDAAVRNGAKDSPNAILAWKEANKLLATLENMARKGEAPTNLQPADLSTYGNYVTELSYSYDNETILRVLARHKEIFNPNALLPAHRHELADGWTAEVLAKDDPRGYTIGTAERGKKCCMRVGKEAESDLVAGYSDPRYGFFVMHDANGRVAAQSLIYVNTEVDATAVVIDSIEVIEGRDRAPVIRRYQEFMQDYLAAAFEGHPTPIQKVIVGRESKSGLKRERSIATPRPGTYTDAMEQWLLYERTPLSEKLRFIPLSYDDAAKVNELEQQIYPADIAEAAGRFKGSEMSATMTIENYSYWLESEGQKIGYVIAYEDKAHKHDTRSAEDEKVLYVEDLGILLEYQQQGLGREAFLGLTRLAGRLGLPMMFHARDNTSWAILASHQKELSRLGIRIVTDEPLPNYYGDSEGAHLVTIA